MLLSTNRYTHRFWRNRLQQVRQACRLLLPIELGKTQLVKGLYQQAILSRTLPSLLQVSRFVSKSRSAVKKLDRAKQSDELLSVRVRSKKHEIIIAPEFSSGHDYTLVVIQNPSVE